MMLQRSCTRFVRLVPRSSSRLRRSLVTTATSSTSTPGAAPVALIFDTETSHLVNFKKPLSDPSQPDLVQLGMILVDTVEWKKRLQVSLLIDTATTIGKEAGDIHGITNDDCRAFGVSLSAAATLFHQACRKADCLVAHNLQFDRTVLQASFHRLGQPQFLESMDALCQICTMQVSTDILRLPGRFDPKRYKWPSLKEAHRHFMGSCGVENAHSALADAEACLSVFRGLVATKAVALHVRDKPEDLPKFPSPGSVVVPETKPQPAETRPTVPVIIVFQGAGFEVIGGTYNYRESLKSLGGVWVGSRKAWVFPCRVVWPQVEKVLPPSLLIFS